MGQISREARDLGSVVVDTNLADSDEIQYSQWSAGTLHVRNGSSLTTLTWHTSNDGTTYEAAYDADGNAVTQTVAADRSYPIPVALHGASFLKATGNVDGVIYVCVKG